jgi:pimeloyl-ACP methyl ester carboxylesterase
MSRPIDRKLLEVPTPDGRWLAAELAGAEDGDLVVFHNGAPGSRHLFEGQVRECARRGLRIVCASRPGYDGSPRQPGRTYGDNPADTLALLEFLGVERAYVIGHSCGGAPALADAAMLPDRVRVAVVAASMAPRLEMGPGWWQGLEDANGEELATLQEGEPALREFVEERRDEMLGVREAEQITGHPDFGRLYSEVDRACFEGEFLAFALETFDLIARDSADGWIDDDYALYGDWGFDLGDVACPVTIWQGGTDRIIPVAHASWLADNVPGADFRLLPDEGHVSLLVRRFGEMLDEAVALG